MYKQWLRLFVVLQVGSIEGLTLCFGQSSAGNGEISAGHESARTTGLYDRRDAAVALDEVDRVVF
jgi:hypothetical protein